ncbi:MAG: hypothetical protein VXY35_04860 [Candidatus Thermoplasmatota archaeon]|nr:hypothetical protein [Candidatus Thermoplasmatota archaeon]
MSDVGSPLDYYARVFGNFEFSVAGVFALNHAVAFIGMITGVFLAGLALYFQVRQQRPEESSHRNDSVD